MKKIPLRQCLGCRQMKPKNELIRVVRSPEGKISEDNIAEDGVSGDSITEDGVSGGHVSLDTTGKKSGRGAYVCRDINCFNRIIKSKALSRAFKMQIPESIITEIAESVKHPQVSTD
jgi:predicted RNA-binding protein YlxR (DUF448 family)